jgi:hypothetical protein
MSMPYCSRQRGGERSLAEALHNAMAVGEQPRSLNLHLAPARQSSCGPKNL